MVDLPQPDGPTREVKEPDGKSILMSVRTSREFSSATAVFAFFPFFSAFAVIDFEFFFFSAFAVVDFEFSFFPAGVESDLSLLYA